MSENYQRIFFRKKSYEKFYLQTFFSKFVIQNGGEIPENELSTVFSKLIDEALQTSEKEMEYQALKIGVVLNGYGLGLLQFKNCYHIRETFL